jgi:hypothetical protein
MLYVLCGLAYTIFTFVFKSREFKIVCLLLKFSYNFSGNSPLHLIKFVVYLTTCLYFNLIFFNTQNGDETPEIVQTDFLLLCS